ncbi:31315_t:CDS:2, partial [Racocetra persica]
FIKWCKFCDREQFQKQFSNWETGSSEFNKIIRDSQLSIKYPNVYIQWIPYEKFSNIEFVGKGAFAKVYKADWIEGIGVWDYALGKRVQHLNAPVALKELNKSTNISKNFLEEVVAYIKSPSSTVLRCYGISRNPETKEYVMVFPYAHGEICKETHPLRPKVLEGTPPDYEKLMLECWGADPNKRPTTKKLYQKILFWLNEFNKSPLPDTVNQFITSNSGNPDETHIFNNEHFASKLITTKTIKDYTPKDDKVVDANSVNKDVNDDE